MAKDPVLAPCLRTLRKQFNENCPSRDTSSDGWISDQRHKTLVSDHNPDSNGAVRALDVDKDLNTPGLTMAKVIAAICKSRDKRIKYIIFNGKITVKDSNLQKWKKYTGSNPHDKHAHFSVVSGKWLYTDISPFTWPEDPQQILQPESQQLPLVNLPIAVPTPTDPGANAIPTPAPPPVASSVPPPEATVGENALPAATGEAPPPNKFDAFVPQIDTAKAWLTRLTAGTAVGTALAWFFKLPEWLQIGLFGLMVVLIVGGIIMFIKYHKQIFEYVTGMNTLRATNGIGDPVINGRPPSD
jgi:hypothetical protein